MKIDVDQNVKGKFRFNFQKNIEIILGDIPSECLAGLHKIEVIGRSYDKKCKDSFGFYCGKQASEDKLPKIVLCVESILQDMPPWIFIVISFLPRYLIAKTLFHEVGHHCQHMRHGVSGDYKEIDAKNFSRKLVRKFIRREFLWLWIILWPVIIVKRMFNKRKQIPVANV